MCLVYIEAWCNGNTKDFDSFVVGSSPAASANIFPFSLMVKRQTLTLYLVVRVHQGEPIESKTDGNR